MREGIYSSRTFGRDLGSEIVNFRNGFQESPRYPHRLRFLTISILLTALVDTKPCGTSKFWILVNRQMHYIKMVLKRFNVLFLEATGLRKVEIREKVADVREHTMSSLKPIRSGQRTLAIRRTSVTPNILRAGALPSVFSSISIC